MNCRQKASAIRKHCPRTSLGLSVGGEIVDGKASIVRIITIFELIALDDYTKLSIDISKHVYSLYNLRVKIAFS